ncbi:DUF4435 domain-containing protein [Methylomonas sp. 2BW1-5-20]|uniref:DUF4435 domain-containing protein n=1 Tax=Methylomonas sp. 2BW1-5-20 TaxID=3376686 RepID=UPI0040504C83
MELPKRTINETRVKLRLEKTIQEVYVEGTFDRDIYRWIFKHLGFANLCVYPISTLDIPDSALEEHGLTSGCRQRVIAAAKKLASDIDLHSQIIFVIDSDLDYLLEKANYAPPLHGTKGTSIELIFWKKDIILKFLSLGIGCGNPEKKWDELMYFIEPIVHEICIFRAAKEYIGANWKLIDIQDVIKKKEPFSFENYCNKVGDKNAARQEIAEKLPEAIDILTIRAEKLDSSKKLHGHDLVAALGRKLHIDGFSHSFLKNTDDLTRVLMASLEWSFVNTDETIQMFQQILKNSLESD